MGWKQQHKDGVGSDSERSWGPRLRLQITGIRANPEELRHYSVFVVKHTHHISSIPARAVDAPLCCQTTTKKGDETLSCHVKDTPFP